MESIAQPLRRLQEEAAWFARATEARLLWVRTEACLRSTAISVMMRVEYHADNPSPFIALDAPWSGSDLGRGARNTRFAEQFSEKARALLAAGVELGPFEPTAADSTTLEAFAGNLRAACAALRLPLRGIVVVLAPPRVDDPAAFIADVEALVTAPALQALRWVVIETDTEHLQPLSVALGAERALTADFRIDEAEQQRDLAALAGPPPQLSDAALPFPWGPWSSAGAMPHVAPPARKDDPKPPTDEQLRSSGLEPAYLKGGAQELRRLLLGAALALRQHRSSDAIELQKNAAQLCGDMHMTREQVIQLLVLGGYQLAAAAPAQARQTYKQAAALAEDEHLAMQQAQAELGLGMLDAMEQSPEAMTHYAAAGHLAEQASSLPLAIECWRMAGQCANDHAATSKAAECWQRAVSLAQTLSPDVRRSTSAADIARLLANENQAQGHQGLANQQHRQAFEFEHGLAPGAALPDAGR